MNVGRSDGSVCHESCMSAERPSGVSLHAHSRRSAVRNAARVHSEAGCARSGWGRMGSLVCPRGVREGFAEFGQQPTQPYTHAHLYSTQQTHNTQTHTQRHRDTETQRHRDTETQRHRHTHMSAHACVRAHTQHTHGTHTARTHARRRRCSWVRTVVFVTSCTRDAARQTSERADAYHTYPQQPGAMSSG